MDAGDKAFAGFLMLCALGLAFFFGFLVGIDLRQRDAIEANVAEWTIDAKTGQREFRFKTPEVQQ